MYAYCQNNPVMMIDPNGEFPWLILAVVLASGGIQILINILNDEPWYKHVAGAVIGGGFGIYNVWGGAWLYSMINQIEDQMFYDEPFSLEEFSTDFLLTGIIGEFGPKLIKDAPILVKNLVITLGFDRLDEAYQNIKDFVEEVKYETKKAYDDFNRWVLGNTLRRLGVF